MNVSDWLKTHKPEAALGAGGIAVTLFLAYRARKNAGTSSSGTSSGLFGGSSSTAVPTSTADTTNSDAFNGIENQVLGLQQAVLAGAATTSAAAAAAPPAAPTDPYASEVFGGSGYAPGAGGVQVTGIGGAGYTAIPNGDVAGLLLHSGVPIFYQPTKGNFAPAVPGLAPGTPLFQKDPSA